MPSQLPRSQKFKHLINSDGSIRAVTKGQITPQVGDTVVEDDVRHLPHLHKWDANQKKFLAISVGERNAKQQEGVTRASALDAKRTGLITKLQSLDANTRDCLLDLAELVGLDLSS